MIKPHIHTLFITFDAQFLTVKLNSALKNITYMRLHGGIRCTKNHNSSQDEQYALIHVVDSMLHNIFPYFITPNFHSIIIIVITSSPPPPHDYHWHHHCHCYYYYNCTTTPTTMTILFMLLLLLLLLII